MKKRFIFLGPPGAGKGTQAVEFCKKEELLYLSTGDLLRKEVEAGTSLGKEISLIMNRGELVSDSLVLSIVENCLSGESKGWVLDGFPRNLSQAKALEKLLTNINQKIEAVVQIDVGDDFLIERLLSRGRQDDNEEVIRHRLDVYKAQTAPLIEFYRGQEILKTIEGNGEIDLVASRIRKVLF